MNGRSCEAFERLLVEASTGGLSPSDEASLRAHIAGCPACATFERGLSAMDARVRAELSPPDPGDAFFVRARNEVREAILAQRPARPQKVEPTRPTWLQRVRDLFVGERRGFLGAAAGVAAALLVAVLLWPKASRPPVRGIEPAPGAPMGHELQPVEDAPAADGDVLPEISTLSREELSTFASKLTIEAPAEADLEEDPEGAEGQVEGLSSDELRALDQQIAMATMDKGA